jgi:hypothetical protein
VDKRKFTVGSIADQFGYGEKKQAFCDHLEKTLGIHVEKSVAPSHPQGFIRSNGIDLYMQSIGWSKEQRTAALVQIDPFFGMEKEEREKAVAALEKTRTEEKKRKREEAKAAAAAAAVAATVVPDNTDHEKETKKRARPLNDDDNDDDDNDNDAPVYSPEFCAAVDRMAEAVLEVQKIMRGKK